MNQHVKAHERVNADWTVSKVKSHSRTGVEGSAKETPKQPKGVVHAVMSFLGVLFPKPNYLQDEDSIRKVEQTNDLRDGDLGKTLSIKEMEELMDRKHIQKVEQPNDLLDEKKGETMPSDEIEELMGKTYIPKEEKPENEYQKARYEEALKEINEKSAKEIAILQAALESGQITEDEYAVFFSKHQEHHFLRIDNLEVRRKMGRL